MEGDLEERANQFMAKYDKHIIKTEVEIGEPLYEDFRDVCRVPTSSASGLDGWAPKDLALVSDLALKWLVKMLNCIEQAAEWPDSTKTTRAVFLSQKIQPTRKTHWPTGYLKSPQPYTGGGEPQEEGTWMVGLNSGTICHKRWCAPYRGCRRLVQYCHNE